MREAQSDSLKRERPLTTGKVAKLLRVTPATVRSMCERGELNGAIRIGNWWRIPHTALDEYLPETSKR